MSSDFDLEGFLPYKMAVAASRLSRDLARLYSDRFKISVAEWRVLAHLNQSGAVSVREIHHKVDMDKSKVSRAASRLESSGLISKSTNPQDGRLVVLELTDKGRDLVAHIIPLAQDYESRLRDALGVDAETLDRVLSTLIHADTGSV